MFRPVAPSGFAQPMSTSSTSPGSTFARSMACRRAWPPIVAPWVMLKAPRQLLQSGVRAVETTTASAISTLYRIRTRGPHTCARTVGALLPIERGNGPEIPRFCWPGPCSRGVQLSPATCGRSRHYARNIMNQTDFEARIEQDRAGVITDWNAGAERLFGWSRAEAIGQLSNMLIPSRNRHRHDQSLRALLAAPDGRVHSRNITALHRDSHELLVEIALSAQRIDDAWRIVAFAREIGVTQQMPTGLSLGPVRFD